MWLIKGRLLNYREDYATKRLVARPALTKGRLLDYREITSLSAWFPALRGAFSLPFLSRLPLRPAKPAARIVASALEKRSRGPPPPSEATRTRLIN